MDNYELACGFWELNPSPLQQASLTTEHLTSHLTPASVLGFCFCFVADAAVGEEPEVQIL